MFINIYGFFEKWKFYIDIWDVSNSLAKRVEYVDLTSRLNKDSSSRTDKNVNSEKIKIEDITNNESEFVDVSSGEEIPRVFEAQIYEYTKVLIEKGKHFIEQNVVLYLYVKDFPNQVFVT